MQDLRREIHFFDFVDNYYPKFKKLNVVTKSKWMIHDKTSVESSHPPKENILINVGKDLVKASPFKIPPTKPEKDEERKIIEQNNYTNKCLNVIGDQLDKIETKIDSINTESKPVKTDIPLIKIQELKPDLSLKTSQTKTREKIDQMLKELNKVKDEPSTSKLNVINKDIVTVETCSSNSEATSDEEINKLEQAFGKIQRIHSKKPNPTTFTKNWYPRPTPPDMQFEERSFQHQFLVSTDKLYEWNIDGISEQKVLNKLSHLTMVANSYMTNHQLNHIEIIDLLATGFSEKLKSWWEKHLTEESRELIKNSIKRDEEGNPLFDERIGMGIPDGVNTLVFTIIRHFIGQLSNITSRIHDQLSNLKCPTMSDFRWYEDVFTSRVMLRDDSNKPFWKEKFIDGLPNLFAHKIRTVLSNSNEIIDYDTLTYGDIISTIKQEGLKMCIEQRIAKQQYDNKRKAKYEMGNFCEQYGILSIAPSQRKYTKHKKEKYNKQGRIWKKKKNFQPNEYYNKNKKFSKKSNKNYKKYYNKKFDKKKTKCFKCGKYGHFANNCKVKQKINQLQINDKEKEELYNLLELRNIDSENEISPDEIESSSDEYSSSSSSTPEYH
jgi:hypothetical protein